MENPFHDKSAGLSGTDTGGTEAATLLIVEDDGLVAEDIRTSLEKMGYRVAAAVPSGEEAVAQAAVLSPSLVLMDIRLKGAMDGTEAAQKIRSLYDIPVIYLTAYSDDEVVGKARGSEPFGYIIKPFEDRELKTAIEIALYKHRMERRLRESRQWLSATLQCIGDGVIATEAQGRVTFMNPVAETLTGWKMHEAAGRPLAEVFHIVSEASGKRSEDLFEKVVQTGQVFGLANATMLILKDGKSRRLIGDSAAPICNDAGDIIGIVIVFRDITLERQMEEQLHHSQKMLSMGTLAGGIAHEFNNILGGIMGYTELARDDVPHDSPALEDLEEIARLSSRARDVIRQILTFSRKGVQERKLIQPHIALKEGLRVLRATIPVTIEIRQDIDEDSGPIMGDPTQLQQLGINLCLNAAQAMEDSGGVIEVGLKPVVLDAEAVRQYPGLTPGEYVTLTVNDTGTGIAPQIIDRIFDPFFTTKPIGKGSGMGLAVSHGIVKSHGGAITVSSRPGAGTTFTVHLPRAEGEAEVPARAEAIPSGSERILLVDDEDCMVFPTKRMLERLGYTVTAMTSSLETLELFKKDPTRYDLMITDLTMPHLTGERLAAKATAIRPDMPVILLTGYADALDDEKVKNSAIKAFIPKPCKKDDLARTIRLVLDRD